MIEPIEVYYEILMRVTKFELELWKIFRNNGFWFQKLSNEIKTYNNYGVDCIKFISSLMIVDA